MRDMLAHLRRKPRRFAIAVLCTDNHEDPYVLLDLSDQIIVSRGDYDKLAARLEALQKLDRQGEIKVHNPISVQIAMQGWAPSGAKGER